MPLKVDFMKHDGGPEKLVSEAALIFDGPEFGALNGLQLVGFSVWRDDVQGEVYVTFPSRAFGANESRKFYDYLRSHAAVQHGTRILKDWILEQFKLAGGPRPKDYREGRTW